MYGILIFIYIDLIFMVHVGKYTIHGSYRLSNHPKNQPGSQVTGGDWRSIPEPDAKKQSDQPNISLLEGPMADS